MKKVLIPTDFSDNAWDALTYAIRIYDDIPCRFYILNTFMVSPSRITNTLNKDNETKRYRLLKEESENELGKIQNELNKNLLNDKHEYEILSKTGSLVTIIENIVSAKNIDLIVMGTTGATGAKEIFMGSNTVKIIKNIDNCPILSIPVKYEYEEPEKVIFATDLKRHINSMELTCLIELQLIHNFKIRIVHVKKEDSLNMLQQQNINALKQLFNDDSITFEEISANTETAEAITNYSEEHDINMICMLKYERSFIEKLTHKPIIKKISFRSVVPLLVLPV